jgi:hypothetical protein
VAPLSIGELRPLARMFRQGVEGAGESLELLARERGEELAELLRFPAENLRRAIDADNLAALVATTVEHAARLRRDTLGASRRASARALVAALRERSEPRPDGSIALDSLLLADILALWGHGAVVFGERGRVGAARLRAILRECHGVTSSTVVLATDSLVVRYETPCSRGTIRLHLLPIVEDDDALHVPIDDGPMNIGAEVPATAPTPVPEPGPIDTTEPPPLLADDASAPPRARAQPRSRRGFVRWFVEAALAAAIGGGP